MQKIIAYYIKTEQAGAFRILIEALKEILTENLIFDNTGIKLMAMDSTHSILIHMKLDADNLNFPLSKKDACRSKYVKFLQIN